MKRLQAKPGYESLASALDAALQQAQGGKGLDRHADGEPFAEQVICEVDRRLGARGAGQLFQAVKKIYESRRLEPAQEKAELLGAINYVAARVVEINDAE